MALAIALSLGDQHDSTSSTSHETQNHQQHQQQQRQQQSLAPMTSQMASLSEDEILEQVLKLSLTEK